MKGETPMKRVFQKFFVLVLTLQLSSAFAADKPESKEGKDKDLCEVNLKDNRAKLMSSPVNSPISSPACKELEELVKASSSVQEHKNQLIECKKNAEEYSKKYEEFKKVVGFYAKDDDKDDKGEHYKGRCKQMLASRTLGDQKLAESTNKLQSAAKAAGGN